MSKHLLILMFLLLSLFNNKINAQSLSDEVKPDVSESLENDKLELIEAVLAKLKTPRITMQTFLLAMNELKNTDKASTAHLNEAVLTFDLNKIDANLREISGRQLAKKLIYTLDRIENVDLLKIPNYEVGRRWIFRKEKIIFEDNKVDVEISIDRNKDGGWRFTPETMSSINAYYHYSSQLPLADGVKVDLNKMNQVKHFMATWGQEKVFFLAKVLWLGFSVIIFFSLLIFVIIRKLISWYLLRLSQKKDFLFSNEQLKKITLPFGILAFSLVWFSGINIIELNAETYSRFARVIYITISLTSIWTALKIVDLFTSHFFKIAVKSSNKFDDTLVPMISKAIKFVIFILGIILVAHALTFDVRGILAGVGIGGIAIALAAKDTIANFFGSITLILDRPFQIGDHVFLDKTIEGIIENIGFRSTRIRTLENSLVTIPNSVLANMAIDNYGERFSRRLRTYLELDLNTNTDDIDNFCNDFKKYCLSNNLINSSNFNIFINEIANKAISIQLTLYILTRLSEIESQERHRAFKEILKLSKLHNIEFVKLTNTMVLKEVRELPKNLDI